MHLLIRGPTFHNAWNDERKERKLNRNHDVFRNWGRDKNKNKEVKINWKRKMNLS